MELDEKEVSGEEVKSLLKNKEAFFRFLFFKKTVLLLLLFLSSTDLCSQTQKTENSLKPKLYAEIELTYLTGIGNIKFDDLKIKNTTEMYGLRFLVGKPIKPKLGLGLGIGLDGYHNFDYNTLPIFIDFRIFDPFRLAKINYSQKLGMSFESNTIKEGFFLESSLSKDFRPLKKFLIRVGISMKFQQIKNPEIIYIETNPNSNTYTSYFLNAPMFINSLGVNVAIKF